eukprot:CAMPEP_0201946534 /NCGR_PEP_ID=MMETSP0903-20130614/54467_1 /ASSEMBLY_ACC=CAM_ASM_000552 /TAXON_ID=420261 /ORGANISM="Thalassiosira antarctica, Strain CCMP982" /LENGTH=764 /DNA_ID=CAMNT_0048489635 /DNA_START=88 /DNA_END=2379 /DNA_ORIENTATION=-
MNDNGSKSFPVESHSPEHSQLSWPEHVPIPESFLCPISKRLMKYPVVDREGNSFEREKILRYLYLQRRREPWKGFSPVTRNPLRDSDLVDNRALRRREPWKGFSPVTKNPLRESDLVHNGVLQMAIDAALKNALEQEHVNDQSTKRARSRWSLISNSLKVAMKTVSTTRKERVTSDGNVLVPGASPSGSDEDDAANRRSDSKASHVPPHGNSAGTESSDADTNAPSDKKQNTPWEEETEPLHASSMEETQEHQHTHDPKYSRRNRPAAQRAKRTEHHSVTTGDAALDAGIAAVLQAETLGASMVSALRKVPDGNSSHPQQTKVGGHNMIMAGSAVDKFEERLKKKLGEDPAAPAKYELRSTDEIYEGKMRKQISMDREARADSKKQSHSSTVQKKIMVEELHEGPNSSERTIIRSNTTDFGVTSYCSSEFDAGPKEEVDYAQLQEERRRQRRGRRGMLDQKLRKSLERVVTEIKEGDLHKGPNSSQRTIIRSNTTDSGDTSYGSSEFEAGPKEEVDYAQLKEARRRKRKDKKSVLAQEFRDSLTKSGEQTNATVSSAEDSTSNERRTGSDREHQRDRLSQLNRPRVRLPTFQDDFPSRRQLSGLTIDEGNEASEGISESNHTVSSNDAKSLQSEGGDILSHHSASTNGQVAKDKHDEDVDPTGSSTGRTTNNLNAILHEDLLPVAARFHCNRRDSVISWADLDGEIKRAQFLSMKVTNNDAVKLQVELETSSLEAGFGVEPRPSEGGGGSVVPQRRSRGRRRRK